MTDLELLQEMVNQMRDMGLFEDALAKLCAGSHTDTNIALVNWLDLTDAIADRLGVGINDPHLYNKPLF